ncbi:MAG: hypothetical protein JJ971_00620 [Balneolaceae bacterium]|nr:hypothetical protein [Balneolaceae bacterium]MBO6544872.1 hypothetical protein [Balneolaceae bacterium]MBO6646268.1 hypothetical protein [Balneolaceae bacterium]
MKQLLFIIVIATSCNTASDNEMDTVIEEPVTDVTEQEVYSIELSRAIPIDGITLKDGVIYASSGFSGSAVYSIDPENGEVSEIVSSIPAPITTIKAADGKLYSTTYTQEEQLYVTNPDNGDVSRFGSITDGSAGLVQDSEGNFFVSIYGPYQNENNKIYKITSSGESEVYIEGNGIFAPIGLAIDENDNLFIANTTSGRIYKVSKEKEITLFATLGSSDGYYATGHLAYYSGKIYASGNHHNKVFVVDADGVVSTLAGTGVAGFKDGDKEVAQFNVPNGIAVSEDGKRLYVLDGGQSTRRRLRVIKL